MDFFLSGLTTGTMTEVGVVLLLVVPEALGTDGLTEIGKSAIRPILNLLRQRERGRERERVNCGFRSSVLSWS